MKTALIMMTILGCDDSVSQCQFVETPPERFVSVELCDAASETVLERYSNIAFPTAVAVCQEPPPEIADAIAESTEANAAAAASATPTLTEEHKTLTSRAIDSIREVLPGRAQFKMIFETPIHVVSDSYSWVAKKIIP
ncbi:hypothetical protein [Rhizobium sp. AG855]|uniref:hypothetical protein n=1 Tax=Rhizobium sp. AG855 TaxID=2183898 RepID=UPI000E74F64F|nr:hypothetical protein [Rhizobium sp. AG855]RKE84834.1 hypothetical protein DFO46_1609 [Rhizobium sp. AG855]